MIEFCVQFFENEFEGCKSSEFKYESIRFNVKDIKVLLEGLKFNPKIVYVSYERKFNTLRYDRYETNILKYELPSFDRIHKITKARCFKK